MDDPADVREETPAPLPGAAEAGIAGAQDAKPRWDGGISKNRMGRLATIPVTVRWDSASVVQQALASKHSSDAALIAAAAPADYVISVQGLLPSSEARPGATIRPADSSDSDDRTAQVRSAEENLEWFMANSRLLVKGQSPIQPVNVKIDPKSGAVHIFFPRSESLAAHKRDVIFVTRFGTMNVQARFRVKDMLVNGKPDL